MLHFIEIRACWTQASPAVGEITQGQQRLAEITEMIHTASLLHDDVMDHGEMRRGVRALNSVHGNKLAILAGDFLLSRASLNLARLRNVEVIELLSTVIAHLVEGEIMQSRTEVCLIASPESRGSAHGPCAADSLLTRQRRASHRCRRRPTLSTTCEKRTSRQRRSSHTAAWAPCCLVAMRR
jgi:hypothetical protein